MTLEQDREYAETRIRELEEELNAKNGENKMHRTTSEDIQLLKFKNCTFTPHNGSMSFNSRNKMENGSIDNLINFFENEL